MALEAYPSNEQLNFIIYDTISANPYSFHGGSSETTTTTTSVSLENNDNNFKPQDDDGSGSAFFGRRSSSRRNNNNNLAAVQGGRKKRRRRPKACKNKEEAETQRMTHIVVERNRRRQMNEHLAVIRSLMPESYVLRGDQASIVGGAIEFVKELEHLLQTLEAQKVQLLHQRAADMDETTITTAATATAKPSSSSSSSSPPFAQFFAYPQYTCSQIPNKYTTKSTAAIADIEVTLIETHANLRILSRKSPKQLSKMVAGFQTLCLTILHLNVTTIDSLVLYSISAKVDEGCLLNTVDDIAGAVHHMLRIIEEEAVLC